MEKTLTPLTKHINENGRQHTQGENKRQSDNRNSCVKCQAKWLCFPFDWNSKQKRNIFRQCRWSKNWRNSEMTNVSFFMCLNSFESHSQHSCKLLSIITYAFFLSATVKCVNQFNSLESSSMKNWNYTYVERYECLSNGTTQTSPNQFRLIQLDVNMRDIVQSNGSINQLITWSVIRNHV